MPKLAVVSLGCSKNLVDTEIMLGQMVSEGWEITQDFKSAEVILLNTCGFIETAKQESINSILEMAQYKQPDFGNCQKLIVAGCLVQRYISELSQEIPEVDYWIGLGEIDAIASIIKEIPTKKTISQQTPYLNDRNLPRYQVTLSHTAFVKIAEGCSHRCAYCAIPIIKGPFRSRKPEAIVNEIQGLLQTGVKEINLIGQDISMYGADLEQKINLSVLLQRIVAEAKPEWIRLLYAYPSGITTELLELIAAEDSICKYLDLPFQHINSRILKLMNRKDAPELLREKLKQIKSTIPEITLRTTFIVGFPTETDQEFDELLEFICEGHFNHAGVFTYSREEQTAAYKLKPQITKAVMEARQRKLLEAQQKISARYLKKLVGTEQMVLVDKVFEDGRAIGRSAMFAPEIDGVINIENYNDEPGKFIKCKIINSDDYNLTAKL
ncbi:MAG TPA: 30S ribosomal protein S12 methylthiotransferase RimO [Bacillota bacterium]|jgi:ribosomal protein S12 methylthiotransferase|nr:30S ribosomal protein S12 methylthiotransferase RimO [Bacillota bacterium]HOL08727.1 30S ribosomal protein S12 methylthiotransferase RimO [Bacillota bacterium]HPO96370.1 30S ribosomal protein S12 methylthiotransferase RimO [Bacillota bacterium]